ncbi:MAG: heat-inducible transcriptional repressor HrcA, partial [Terriglobia bacterium]
GYELDSRQREVLASIIRQFVSTGMPVASRAVAARLSEALSAATIRNVMAELEEAGYLTHPHTSAGRVPEDKAYRFYVDCVARFARLTPATQRYIEESLGPENAQLDELMERISGILSEVSNGLGVVLGPAFEEKLLEHIKFVRLTDQRVLAVLVSKPDLVENRIFRMEDDPAQEDLDRAADFLNAEFRGWSLRTIRLEMAEWMDAMRAASDRLLTTVIQLFVCGGLGEQKVGELFVGGAARLLDQPEFLDVEKLKELWTAVDEKAKMVKILSACLDAPHRGVQALIGRENPHSEMRQCSVILAPYHYRQRPVGALGVIGPTRMEYDLALTTVEYIAQVTSRVLSAN